MSLKHIFESEGVPLYKTECEHGKEILLNAFRFRAGVKVIVISQISLHLPQRMRSTPRSIQSHLKDSLKNSHHVSIKCVCRKCFHSDRFGGPITRRQTEKKIREAEILSGHLRQKPFEMGKRSKDGDERALLESASSGGEESMWINRTRNTTLSSYCYTFCSLVY